jgi:hypothetical protein
MRVERTLSKSLFVWSGGKVEVFIEYKSDSPIGSPFFNHTISHKGKHSTWHERETSLAVVNTPMYGCSRPINVGGAINIQYQQKGYRVRRNTHKRTMLIIQDIFAPTPVQFTVNRPNQIKQFFLLSFSPSSFMFLTKCTLWYFRAQKALSI